VLLLENGGSPNPMQNVPFYFQSLLHIPQIDYEYYTVPQKHACLAMQEQRSFWPRGMGLGGTSNLNCMLWQRSSRHDYDRWAKLSGSDEWKFDNVLRNFKNIEDYHGSYNNDKWHSHDGKGVYVSTVEHTNLLEEFFEAGREMGYPTKNVNGNQEPRSAFWGISSFSGTSSQQDEPTHLQIFSCFLKHLDQKQTWRLVTYKRHGVERFVKAKREIIISAGAIDSPKLLMLSGIGPKDHLESLGIKCLINLPVGRNLMDHIMAMFGPFTVETPGKTNVLGRDITLNTVSDYFSKRKGFMASAIGANAVAYVHSSLSKEGGNILNKPPDIQLLFIPASLSVPDAFEDFFKFKKGVIQKYVNGFEDKDSFMVNVMLGKYSSRGEIKLASADPTKKPVMDPKYFSHPDDIRRMVDGMNFTVEMAENTKAFRKIGTRLINRHLPGCEKFELKGEKYYECYARHMTSTVYHQCGTCRMGNGIKDPKAVVDSKFRVLHAKGLRVVDASIIPEIPNGNINSAVFMIADKASEFILDYWAKVDNYKQGRRGVDKELLSTAHIL
ncbi:Glucose dehydrogenase [FAD, quinone], partial [Orchesella cincta]